MPGTKSSGRPGGNPEYGKKYKFGKTQSVFDEPCNAKLAVRVPESFLKEIQARENWQDFVRVAIATALKNSAKVTGQLTLTTTETTEQPQATETNYHQESTPSQLEPEHQGEETPSKATSTRKRKQANPRTRTIAH